MIKRTAPDQKNVQADTFLFLYENICCVYSFEALSNALLMSFHNISIKISGLGRKKKAAVCGAVVRGYIQIDI